MKFIIALSLILSSLVMLIVSRKCDAKNPYEMIIQIVLLLTALLFDVVGMALLW